MIANHWKYCVLLMSNNILKDKKNIWENIIMQRRMAEKKHLFDCRYYILDKLKINWLELKIRERKLYYKQQVIDLATEIDTLCSTLHSQPIRQSWQESNDVIRNAAFNCRSFQTNQRRLKLDALLSKKDPDINCLTETWFDSNGDDCEIFPNSNYQLQKWTDREIGARCFDSPQI